MANTSSGCLDAGPVTGAIDCCPPAICAPDCCTFASSFISMLPTGPLWDDQKIAAQRWVAAYCDDPNNVPAVEECTGLAFHAAYTGLKLQYLRDNVLWPTLRESHPDTAVTSIDDWLSRMNWSDCFQSCKAGVRLENNPLLVRTECGTVLNDQLPQDVQTEDQQSALKRAIARALHRARIGAKKNLCGLNWILEPLSAELQHDDAPECIDCETGEVITDPGPAKDGDCCEPTLRLVSTDTTIEGVPGLLCTDPVADRQATAVDIVFTGIGTATDGVATAIVVDTSFNASAIAAGATATDMNGDGNVGTILDSFIESIIAWAQAQAVAADAAPVLLVTSETIGTPVPNVQINTTVGALRALTTEALSQAFFATFIQQDPFSVAMDAADGLAAADAFFTAQAADVNQIAILAAFGADIGTDPTAAYAAVTGAPNNATSDVIYFDNGQFGDQASLQAIDDDGNVTQATIGNPADLTAVLVPVTVAEAGDLTRTVFPNLLAAECIIRSIMGPLGCRISLRRVDA